MIFSRTAVHGIYAICYLNRQPTGCVVPSATVAVALGITQAHAAKVLKRLSIAGIITSTRGRQGGYSLTKKMEEIPVVDVLDALNPSRDQSYLRAEICQGDKAKMCNAHRGLLRMEDNMRGTLSGETLQGMAGSVCTSDGILSDRTKCHSKGTCASLTVL